MPKRQVLVLAALLLIPMALSAQVARAALDPAATPSLAIPNAFACAADCLPAAVLAVPHTGATQPVVQDAARRGRSGMIHGAAIGGMVGATTIAIYTLWDNQEAPPTWWEALAAPVAGALVGAGIGLLF